MFGNRRFGGVCHSLMRSTIRLNSSLIHCFLDCLFQFTGFLLDLLDSLFSHDFILLDGVLHRLLDIAQFIQMHLTVDISLDLGRIAVETADPGADGPGNLGQALWTDDDERNDADQQQFWEADTKHQICNG